MKIYKVNVVVIVLIISAFVCLYNLPAREAFDSTFGIRLANDSLYPPEIEIIPSELHFDFQAGEFVVKDITILNRGGQPLEIYGMRGSCFCANAAVIHSYIVPFSKGTVRLSFNTKKLTDSLQRIDYVIRTNTPDSFITYRVYLRLIPIDTNSH